MNHLFWLELACWSWFSLFGGVDTPAPIEQPVVAPPIEQPVVVTPIEQPVTVTPAPDFSMSVDLVSGRTFSGMLDPRTDTEQLWLRFQSDGAQILRPIDWDRVASVKFGGQKLTGPELHRMVQQVRQEMPAIRADSDAPKERNIILVSANAAESAVEPESIATAEPRRVVSLDLDVRVAQWDADAEADGIEVRIYPRDAEGNVVPVRGTLTVNLKLVRRGPNTRERPYFEAGNWSESVQIDDFGYNGAVYHLEYQNVRPNAEKHVRSHGIVHATLSVPGQGTFEAVEDLFAMRLH